MSTFITRLDSAATGVRLAVKDIIDVEGVPTTAGCRAVADRAEPALRDATCLAGARLAGANIVGKTNLHELALGVTGVNPWFGTPVNPLDPSRVPGGSSSGSAVAVATGEADVAYGSDTGGSVRIPSACCGTAGLKTTWGRIPRDGVWPLSPHFDTIGPMARDVVGLVTGMELLEPGFAIAPPTPMRIGRIRVDAHPDIDAALDSLLSLMAQEGWQVVDVEVPEWEDVGAAGGVLLVAEAWETDHGLVEDHSDQIGADVVARLHMGRDLLPFVPDALVTQRQWGDRMHQLFGEVDFLATPTLSIFPPTMEDADDLLVARCTLAVNLAGVPALSLPVPTSGPLPTSLQLIGPWGSEERLLTAGMAIEAGAESL